MIEITTLGRPTIRRDGVELAGLAAHRQKLALLVYLALESPVARDRLLALFWSERDEEKARHSLSQALYSLKRELDEECVRTVGDTVSSTPETCTVDARQLEEAAAQESWATVIDLYTGRFLDGFSLTGAPDFEEWLSRTRARLARLARRAFRRTIELQLEAEDAPAALAAALRWTELEPLDDEAQHSLIALLAYTGDRGEALKQFNAFRSRLARELSAEPLGETSLLAERIKAGATPEFKPPVVPDGRDASEAGPPAPAPTPSNWSSLLSELRRRWVFHVGLAYLAFSAVALEMTDVLIQNGILQGWVFQTVLFFLALGLPIVLLIAWAQEHPRALQEDARVRRIWPRWAEKLRPGVILALLLVSAVGLFAGQRILTREVGTPEVELARPEPPRIAVRPFTDRSSDGSLELLATELTRDLIDRLQDVKALDVISFSGVRPYTRLAVTADSMAQVFDAGFIVEGDLEPVGDSIRATIRLIDSSNVQRHRFPVQRPGGEPLELQDEIADLLAHGLRQLIGEITLAGPRYPTASNDAWRTFAQARRQHEYGEDLLGERGFEAAGLYLERADTLFARAQRLDDRWLAPILARGWLDRDRIRLIRDRGGMSTAEPLPLIADLARSGLLHAERALDLLPGDARALELRGTLRYELAIWGERADQDSLIEAAEADLTTAVQLDESLVRAWYMLSRLHRHAGNQAQATFCAQKGLEADIYAEDSRAVLTELFHGSMHRGAYEEAESWCAQGRTYYPKSTTFQWCRLTLLGWTASTAEAVDSAWSEVALMDSLASLDSSIPHRRFYVAAILARAGLADSALSVIAGARDEAPDYLQDDLAALEAWVLTILGEHERALDLLALQLEREPQRKGFVAEHPWYKDLRDYPRFRELVGSEP